jgi:hypothetical protein
VKLAYHADGKLHSKGISGSLELLSVLLYVDDMVLLRSPNK